MSTEKGMLNAVRQGLVSGLSASDRGAFSDFTSRVMSGEFVFDRGGLSEISYKDLFMQAHGQFDWVSAGVAIATIHAEIRTGASAVVAVRVGAKPLRDLDREENNAMLCAGLESASRCCGVAWSGEVYDSQCHGPDGVVRWDSSADRSPNALNKAAFGDESDAALEVGSCHPLQFYSRVFDYGGCIARWPYASEWVYVVGRSAWLRAEIYDSPDYGRIMCSVA